MTHKNDLNFNAKLNGKEKFGFRKLSAGLAAVVLGTTFFLSSGQLVHAYETSANQQTTTEVKDTTQSSDQQTAETKTADTNDSSKSTDTTQTETPVTTPTSSETNSNNNTQESTSTNKGEKSNSNNEETTH